MSRSVVKEFSFDAGHRVLGHGGKCAFAHGHSYKGRVEVSAVQLNELSMVMDFYDLKEILSPLIAEWDHAMVFGRGDPLGTALEALGQRVAYVPANATVEMMAQVLYDRLEEKLAPLGVLVEQVVLWETPTASAVVKRERG